MKPKTRILEGRRGFGFSPDLPRTAALQPRLSGAAFSFGKSILSVMVWFRQLYFLSYGTQVPGLRLHKTRGTAV